MKKTLFILLILLSNKSHSQTSTLLNGIVSYWKLDDAIGVAAIDVVSGNNGGLTNVTQNAPGKINKAYIFNGTSSKVDMGNPSNLSLTSAGSVSCWIYMPILPSTDEIGR